LGFLSLDVLRRQVEHLLLKLTDTRLKYTHVGLGSLGAISF